MPLAKARRARKPRSSVPVNYRRVRLPRGKILLRIEEGNRLRRGHRDPADAGSVYARRGLIVV